MEERAISPIQAKRIASEGKKVCTSSFHEGPRELPAEERFFYRKASTWDGWSPICKLCHHKQIENTRNLKRELQQREGVKAIIALTRSHKSVPHATELLEALMEETNGVEEFAKFFVEGMYTAAPGSPQQLKAAQAIMALVVKNTEMGHAQKPIELFTDEELEQYLLTNEEKVREAANTLQIESFTEEHDAGDDDIEPGSEAGSDEGGAGPRG